MNAYEIQIQSVQMQNWKKSQTEKYTLDKTVIHFVSDLSFTHFYLVSFKV